MKNIKLTLLLCLATSIAIAQQMPYKEPVPYKQLKQTIGEIYVVPKRAERLADMGYLFLKEVANPTKKLFNNDVAGKRLKLISIVNKKALFKDSVGTEYSCYARETSIAHVCYEPDVIESRKLFLGKKLWLKNPYMLIRDNELSKTNMIEGLRLDPVTVTSITIGEGDQYPVRFNLKTADNKVGFLDVIVSGTNSDFDEKNYFSNNFFTEDVKLKYHFTPKIWYYIKTQSITLGMDKDAVELAIGPPTKRDNSSVASGLDQWVYADQYVYFQNNKVVDIKPKQ